MSESAGRSSATAVFSESEQVFRAILTKLYGATAAAIYTSKLLALITSTDNSLRRSEVNEADTVLIAFGDHFRRDGETPLRTLGSMASKHFRELIDTVHLLPFYPFTCDRGFGVTDFMNVHPDYGTWADIDLMANDFHLAFDVVVNHVSGSHPWFKAFLAGDPKYANYFITVDPDADISNVFRPRTTPLLTPFETADGIKHLWTTFSADQIDLNYQNPEVLLEMVRVIIFYVDHGADVLRMDAINYIWKDPNTSCNGLPQAHTILQLFRAALNAARPWVRILSETNVAQKDNVTYFGDGHNESHMVYNFALPSLALNSLLTGSAVALSEWATTLTTPSDETTFLNFVASHDGITVESGRAFIPNDQMEAMFHKVSERGGRLSYSTTPTGGVVYEMNIAVFSLLSGPGEPLERSVDRVVCSQAIMLSLAGVPGIYLNSLIGSVNWPEGLIGKPYETEFNRSINEQKFDADTIDAELSDKLSRRSQVFTRLSQLLRARRAEPAFRPQAGQEVLKLHQSVFALERNSVDGRAKVIALHNVSGRSAIVKLPPGRWHSLLTGTAKESECALSPYEVAWLKLRDKLELPLRASESVSKR